MCKGSKWIIVLLFSPSEYSRRSLEYSPTPICNVGVVKAQGAWMKNLMANFLQWNQWNLFYFLFLFFFKKKKERKKKRTK